MTGPATRLLATRDGLVAGRDGAYRRLVATATVDALLAAPSPLTTLSEWYDGGEPTDPPGDAALLAPIGSQEVWAAGVTYERSRTARVAEAEQAGGDVFYDLVYDAARPELFFKATSHRVVGPGGEVRIRRDSHWNVPEPELALVVSSRGEIVGYTIGNDMSSRSIEGENPLYLPQAKIYSGSAALGPVLVVSGGPPPAATTISMVIARSGADLFTGSTSLERLKRSPSELVDYLFRDNDFPTGVFLMTGTGIVPDDDFTLQPGDSISIAIDGVGTLVNVVGPVAGSA
jgi:2-dehydro-3-deoxy-D-arabinonate dehydratase